MAQNIIYSPREGTKGPWLCLMTKLLLSSLLWLFSFISAFSHLSDYTYSLAKVFPQTKGRRRTWGQGPQSSAPLQNLPFGEKASPKGCLCLESEFSRPPSLGEGNRCFLPFCPSLRTVWKSLRNPTVAGNSLAVQWLGLAAFTAVAWVGSLVGKLRPCKLCGMMRKERKTNSGFVDQESEVTSSLHLACQSLRHHRSGRGVAVASLIFLMW